MFFPLYLGTLDTSLLKRGNLRLDGFNAVCDFIDASQH